MLFRSIPIRPSLLICGVCGIGDVSKLGRIGIKSLALFLLSTGLAIALAILVAENIGPGKGFQSTQNMENTFEAPEAPPLTQVIIDLVPGNPLAAFIDGNMLQIIFFTILFSICLLMIGERGRALIESVEKLNEVMMQMVGIVMSLAPYGIFAIMAQTFALQGIGLILPMIGYFCVVIAVLIMHVAGTLMVLLKLLGKVSPIQFLKKVRTAQLFAFSTSSSNATIPVTLKTLEKRMGVDNSTASFVVPLGATINMDGTALYQVVAAVFLTQVFGIELSSGALLLLITTTIGASIGSPSTPGVGIVILATILTNIGVPASGIALIIGVDRILDMSRTAINVTGDLTACVVMDRWLPSKPIDREVV